MATEPRTPFCPDDLRKRYDIEDIHEDEWHSYTDGKTRAVLERNLRRTNRNGSHWLLNAGAGIYRIDVSGWTEVAVDLFANPIQRMPLPVCADIHKLPFRNGQFGVVVCVGEVLAYCDPASVIAEFGRVTQLGGILICDFASSRSFRHWMRPTFGKAAALLEDQYNGSLERVRVYDPAYILAALKSSRFTIKETHGTHIWSTLARRFGLSIPKALKVQNSFEWLSVAQRWADITTVVAARV